MTLNVTPGNSEPGSVLNHIQFEIHGRSAWLGEGRFPYDGFPERPCSDRCYELIMNAGDRRWRTGAVWP